MNLQKKSRRLPAFTLLEVTVAIAIFAVTATILLSAIGNSYAVQDAFLKRDTRQEDRREIVREIISISMSDSSKLDSGGDYKTNDGNDVRWNTNAEETEQAGLFRLNIEIDWGDNNSKEIMTFYTFRPEWKTQFNSQEALIENLREAFPQDRFDSY